MSKSGENLTFQEISAKAFMGGDIDWRLSPQHKRELQYVIYEASKMKNPIIQENVKTLVFLALKGSGNHGSGRKDLYDMARAIRCAFGGCFEGESDYPGLDGYILHEHMKEIAGPHERAVSDAAEALKSAMEKHLGIKIDSKETPECAELMIA